MKFIFLIIGIFIAGGESVYSEPATREISGVRFDENITAAGQSFKLQNAGLLRYKVIFKGYVAALYLGDMVSIEDIFEDVPKRLEFYYFWNISGKDFGLESDKVLERNEPALLLEKLRRRLENLHKAYQDVKPKDRYALTYVPGRGTELTLNGRPLIIITGSDFARVYFDIWLGNNPFDKGLRAALLGAAED